MEDDAHLRIEVLHEGNRVVVLGLGGELDLAGAPQLAAELEGPAVERAATVALDLHELRFIDSAGLRVILAAHARAGERGQTFALTRGSQQVQRLLEIAGVDELVRIVGSTAELV